MTPAETAAGAVGDGREVRALRLLWRLLSRSGNGCNAGPQRVEQYHGVPPYPETVDYVSRVIRNLNQRSGRSQQPFGKQVTDRSVGQSQKGTRSERRKAGALFEASKAGAGRDFERHPLSIN